MLKEISIIYRSTCARENSSQLVNALESSAAVLAVSIRSRESLFSSRLKYITVGDSGEFMAQSTNQNQTKHTDSPNADSSVSLFLG